jgi:regulator of protease activity HflC (stomatin/prohibitin superfamily)
MVSYVSLLPFVVLLAVGVPVAARVATNNRPAALIFIIVWVLGALVIASAIRLAAEWERAVVFRLGKFLRVKGPGLFLIVPLVDRLRRIDTRVETIQIARQQVITKDNVPVSIDAVNLAVAADMAKSPGAMHLRTLQTIDGLGPSASNTVVLAVPVEMMKILSGLKEMLRSRPS